MRFAYGKSRAQDVLCKSDKQCFGLLKQVLKPYSNFSERQFYNMKIAQDFFMMSSAIAYAIKIACDNAEQKSYRTM